MTAALLTTEPLVLVDVEDLAEADLEADLAERLALCCPGSRGPVPTRGDVPVTPADAVALAAGIHRAGAAAVAGHHLGARAALLTR
ncbi:hypothetical protein [Geodermatophilus sp. DSM 44513]|uniref:hypothetical protein n=1 Tax=Geodermatophilus sp. DSM 44513 TaxID=1528104 RepID=UPI00127AFEFB|nr:hypothetical protein [Geodermatophilus sp. DSM 44513]WNV73969.1 hypothetical protein RTG05_13330 [Geodermatophilus sp. DSM 44513]